MVVVLVFNQRVLRKAFQQSVHPTLGILPHFQAFFYASAFFQSDGVPPPAPAQVTQTVRQPKCKTKYVFESQVSFLVCLKKKIHFLSLVIFLAVVSVGLLFRSLWF